MKGSVIKIWIFAIKYVWIYSANFQLSYFVVFWVAGFSHFCENRRNMKLKMIFIWVILIIFISLHFVKSVKNIWIANCSQEILRESSSPSFFENRGKKKIWGNNSTVRPRYKAIPISANFVSKLFSIVPKNSTHWVCQNAKNSAYWVLIFSKLHYSK